MLTVDAADRQAPILSVFGGKLTTYRKLAEQALRQLVPHLPGLADRPAWTGRAPLPGGDFPIDGFATLVTELRRDFPFLFPAQAARLVRHYGTRARVILGQARQAADLGQDFGAGLTQAEVDYLVTEEWARSAADVVWRRTKLGLRLDDAAIDASRPLHPGSDRQRNRAGELSRNAGWVARRSPFRICEKLLPVILSQPQSG